MSKRILFSVFAVAFFWSTAAVLAQEQVPTPVFKEGDTWQFNITHKNWVASSTEYLEGVHELTFTQGNVKIFQISGSQKNEIAIKPDGETQVLLTVLGKSTQLPDLKFPFSVGQKWSYDYETRLPGAPRDQRRSVEVNVTGMEQVTMPAGSFKAYKLVRSTSWSGTGRLATRTGSTSTYFFSPEIKSVVKSSTTYDNNSQTLEIELIKFTPGN
jgi:hypothetical protein